MSTSLSTIKEGDPVALYDRGEEWKEPSPWAGLGGPGMSTTCGNCAIWNLRDSPLRSAGFGLCLRELPIFRGARTFSSHAPCCRPIEYVPAAQGEIERRERELA